MYIHYQFAPRSGGRMTWVCCVSQTRVMLRAIALVILPSFQSGLHPDDGHALQSSLDLRPKWRVLPWRRWLEQFSIIMTWFTWNLTAVNQNSHAFKLNLAGPLNFCTAQCTDMVHNSMIPWWPVHSAQFNYNLVHRNNAQNAGQSAVLEERQ